VAVFGVTEIKRMTILIVDDEPSVLRYIATVLRKEGYEVLQADGGDEALAICESHAGYIDLMVSDIAMPRMNGRALAECMNQRYPGVPIIFVSGYPASRELVAGLTARGFENGYSYLQKPFKPQELLRAIATAFKAVTKLKTSTASS
jgi:CheY-like chemotaxis protein